MEVYYCFDRIGVGKRKMPALTVIYENGDINKRYFRTLWIAYNKPFFERNQTDFEESCAEYATRVFSTYTYFFKKYKSTDDVVEQCIQDDKFLQQNTVEANRFRKAFYEALDFYGHIKKDKNKEQLKLSI